MRIALLADEDPGWGGIGTYTGILGAALRELGHDVHLVLRGWEEPGTEVHDGLTVHRVSVPPPSWRRGTVAAVSRLFVARESVLFATAAARVIGRIGADVVEAPEFHALGLIAALNARLAGRQRVVVRLHAPSFLTARLAGDRPCLDLRAGEALEALSARCARSVTAPSGALAATVAARWRIKAQSVTIVPNPIDDELFAPARAGNSERAGSILVVGRIERAKGQDVLIEALPAIRGAVPDAHVRLIGANGGAATALAHRARELGVADAVTFEDAVARERLPAAYRAAAVCVVPSRFEAFGYTCVEAMACGRPVVAARAGALPEVLSGGREGLLVAPEDPAALAAALVRLLPDGHERQRLGAAARARVLSSFAGRAVAARMTDHYKAVLG